MKVSAATSCPPPPHTHTQVLPTLEAWRVKAQVGGRISEACMLHAHLAYLFKAVQVAELDVFSAVTLLSANIFLQHNYGFSVEVGGEV